MMVKFFETIKKYNMFSPGQKVIVGLSGGADSMCLVSLLNKHKLELGIVLEAAHINHCIRGDEALRDENFVREFCEKEEIPLHVLTADIPALAALSGESTELCARRVRYEYFASLNADIIATAHTGSDRIETMLMNLTRGATLTGLCSIPPVRGNIVRPLIGILRTEIEDYCRKESVAYIVDSSNLTDDYTRNKFRNNVIPMLSCINPAFEKNALRCIESINDEELYFSLYVNELYTGLVDSDGNLNVNAVLGLDLSVKKRVVRLFIENTINSDYEMKHIDRIVNSLGSTFAVVLPGNFRISGDKEKLYYDRFSECKETFSGLTTVKGKDCVAERGNDKLLLKWADILPDDVTGCFIADADKINDSIVIRTRIAGDVFHLGKRRCSKTLKKLFNELKIPAEKRDSLFVVADENGLIFAEEAGIDAMREINNRTKKFLIIKTECGKNNE